MEGQTRKDFEGLHQEDRFNCLPDSIVRVIFNKVMDAKSLCRCLAVSKRFSFFIPQTDTISFTISHRRNPNPNPNPNEVEPNDCHSLDSWLMFLVETIFNTHCYLYEIFDLTIFAVPNINHEDYSASYILPDEALRNFKDVQSLRIELPCHLKPGNCDAGDPLLKWKAQVHNGALGCVILLARSLCKTNHFTTDLSTENSEESSSEPSFIDYGDRRFRLAASCFCDAVCRYSLTYKIALDHPTLHRLVISDANKRGKVLLGKDHLERIRSSVEPRMTYATSEVNKNLKMEMNVWYAHLLEFQSSGYVMDEVTLILMRAIDEPTLMESSAEAFIAGAFEEEEEVIDEAVTKLIKNKKKKTCQVPFNYLHP